MSIEKELEAVDPCIEAIAAVADAETPEEYEAAAVALADASATLVERVAETGVEEGVLEEEEAEAIDDAVDSAHDGGDEEAMSDE